MRSKIVNDTTMAFALDRPNPHTLVGAIVGGPYTNDVFSDKRSLFEFTEVSLDYNTGLTLGAAAVASFPKEFWEGDCSGIIPFYPWAQARPLLRPHFIPILEDLEANAAHVICSCPQSSRALG
jgi:uncharacterized protein YbbC (DUF1343 family)